MATNVPDVIASNQPNPSGSLILVFNVKLSKKYWLHKYRVENLSVSRNKPTKLRNLSGHIETQLLLPGGHGQKLLLKAVCQSPDSNKEQVVPLVCEEIWTAVVHKYPFSYLKILIDQQQSLVITHNRSCREWLFGKQVKNIDISSYLPSEGLVPDDVFKLCHTIFEKRVSIKQSLRKGVWMHLTGVFPPELKAREDRERYIEKLRMVYDSLKGRRKGEQSNRVHQLIEAVQRDAVRTDPSHPFYTKDNTATESLSPDSISNNQNQSNIQKLVNIITIYILEHGEVSYTQGMTDLLSPFLYVMKREADAYICFAAMVERIKGHFSTWCDSTLLKIERLRHICEVLDPELFHFLTNNIEEDAFALFFGMVLIECRREFSFEDSFQLLEAIWASVVCMKGGMQQNAPIIASKWAHFMTNESEEVIQQVFGETQTPYTARRLPRSSSDTTASITAIRASASQNPSIVSLESREPHFHTVLPKVPGSDNADPSDHTDHSSNIPPEHSVEVYQQIVTVDIEPETQPTHESIPRSFTEPNLKSIEALAQQLNDTIVEKQDKPPAHLSPHSRSESELYDNLSSSKFPVHSAKSKKPTEMADLSSLSSDAISMLSSRNHLPKLKDQTTPTRDNESWYHPTTAEENFPYANETTVIHDEEFSAKSVNIESEDKHINSSTPSQAPLCSVKSIKNQSQLTLEDIDSHTSEGDRSRITPVAFFDVMGSIASCAQENTEVFQGMEILSTDGKHNGRPRVDSNVSLLTSQLITSEQANPKITKERSLNIPVSDCFPLFICMAILSQHRVQIMKKSTDFVGLSVILNAQAGQQNIQNTLFVARDLYRIYRSYQLVYTGHDLQSLNIWLDDVRIKD